MEEVQTERPGTSPNCKTENFPKGKCFAELAGRFSRSTCHVRRRGHMRMSVSVARPSPLLTAAATATVCTERLGSQSYLQFL